jgi:hypothetical protein
MTTLLVQNSKSKFIQSTIYSNIPNVNIIGSNIDNHLYKIYYSHNPTHAIFCANRLTDEIIQFISDFASSKIKCFIYHENLSFEILDKLKDLSVINISSIKIKSEYQSVLLPKNLINSQLFYNNPSVVKKESIVCFIDNYEIIPESISNYLYPKTNIPIKLFNNNSIAHYQNLGLLDESNKANILQSNKYYVSIPNNKNDYSLEASLCGSIVLDVDQIQNYETIEYTEPKDYYDLATFIKESILI